MIESRVLSVFHVLCSLYASLSLLSIHAFVQYSVKRQMGVFILGVIGIFITLQKCSIAWELRVVGWEVSYSAEFVPNTEEAYTVIIQKARKMAATDEPVISQSFKVCELGKVLFTIDNPTSKKKKLLYRFKVKVLGE